MKISFLALLFISSFALAQSQDIKQDIDTRNAVRDEIMLRHQTLVKHFQQRKKMSPEVEKMINEVLNQVKADDEEMLKLQLKLASLQESELSCEVQNEEMVEIRKRIKNLYTDAYNDTKKILHVVFD